MDETKSITLFVREAEGGAMALVLRDCEGEEQVLGVVRKGRNLTSGIADCLQDSIDEMQDALLETLG
jgi:hypothetical protein